MKTDDDQIHQCQQNEQSPLIITELTEHKKRPRHLIIEIQVLAGDRHKHVAGLYHLMRLFVVFSGEAMLLTLFLDRFCRIKTSFFEMQIAFFSYLFYSMIILKF
jgi:hypothetical protein